MKQINVTCKECGHDNNWDSFEEMVQVNAQEGSMPRVIVVGGCACGHRQEVADITE